jgi:[ribosomal protein S5]-alanine N-acetyltransferase
MIETKRLKLEEAREDELGIVVELENAPGIREYIWNSTEEEHRQHLKAHDKLLLLFKTKTEEKIVGYCLIVLDFNSDIFELKRIAMTERGKGYGKEAILAIREYAFENLNANRFWLDVYPDNQVAINLYEKIGLVREGLLRQNFKTKYGYYDYVIFSMLRDEYEEYKKNHNLVLVDSEESEEDTGSDETGTQSLT